MSSDPRRSAISGVVANLGSAVVQFQDDLTLINDPGLRDRYDPMAATFGATVAALRAAPETVADEVANMWSSLDTHPLPERNPEGRRTGSGKQIAAAIGLLSCCRFDGHEVRLH